MQDIRIEKVGDINSLYPYLEVFYGYSTNPFLEIGISEERKLVFKLYAMVNDIELSVDQWENILLVAKDFLPKALKDEDDFNKWANQKRE